MIEMRVSRSMIRAVISLHSGVSADRSPAIAAVSRHSEKIIAVKSTAFMPTRSPRPMPNRRCTSNLLGSLTLYPKPRRLFASSLSAPPLYRQSHTFYCCRNIEIRRLPSRRAGARSKRLSTALRRRKRLGRDFPEEATFNSTITFSVELTPVDRSTTISASLSENSWLCLTLTPGTPRSALTR